jgi:Holliday junction resolvasome RuvABC endonuclease subunit
MVAINQMKSCSISHITYDKIKDHISSNIRCISEKIRDIIKDMRENGEKIDLVVIEDVAMAARGRSIIDLTLLNGYVRCMLDQLGVRYETVTPTQWKKRILGNGQADKELIIYHWAKFDQENCRHMMDMNVKCDDVADAYFLSCWGV